MKLKLTKEELRTLVKALSIAQLDTKSKMLTHDASSDNYLIYLKEHQEIQILYEKIKSGR